MKRLQQAAVPALFAIAGLVVAFQETIFSGFRLQRHDLGDTRFVNWALEHELRWVLGNIWHPDLFDRPFFFPARNVGAYADVYVGALPIYAPLRLFFEYDTAFLAYGFAVSLANFAAMYWLLRRAGGFAQIAAAAGAALFAFANTRLIMAMHWQMFPQYWSIICLFCIWALTQDFTPRQKRVAIFVGIFSIAGQLWSSYYLGWFLLLGLSFATPVVLAMPKVRAPILKALWDFKLTTIAAIAVSAAVLIPLARAYLASAAESGMRPFGEVMTMLPPWQTWINMGWQSIPYGKIAQTFAPLKQIPMEHEQRAALGYLSMVLLFVGFVVGRKRPGVLIAAVTFVLIVVFATHVEGKTLWRLIYDFFPGAQAIRAVSRISLLLLIPAAVGLAAALDALMNVKARKVGIGAAALLSALTVAEQAHVYGAYDVAQNRRDVQAISRLVHSKCEAFVVSPVNDNGPYWKHQLDAMSAQLNVGVPTLNGYSGRAPHHWDLTDIRINSEEHLTSVRKRVQAWIDYSGLNDFRVCHVLVGFGTEKFDAEFRADAPQTITTVVGGQVPLAITAKNVGAEAWNPGGLILFALQWDRDQRAFGPVGVPMLRVVKPGEEVTFELKLRAPSSPGAYEAQFRMLNRQVGWFGPMAPAVRVEVFAAPAL